MKRPVIIFSVLLLAACGNQDNKASNDKAITVTDALTPEEARSIAKDAYMYGYPLVDDHRITYAYFADKERRCTYRQMDCTNYE